MPLNSTDEQIRAFHDKCAAHKVTGYAVGPIYMKSEEEIDRAFDYAKRVGVKLIVGVPNYELLPYVDKKVKEYDFHYAITCTVLILRRIPMLRTFGSIRRI